MAMPEQPPQTNPFQPEMPRIPGVNDEHRAPRSTAPGLTRQMAILAVATLIMVGGGGWWILHVSRSKAQVSQPADAAAVAPAKPAHAFTAALHPRGPEPVATVRELAKPWSSKRFTFYRPDTGVGVPAMIVRLPGVAGNRTDAYWAFSLNAPYELCQLAYVANFGELANGFDYHATHPMVTSSCSRTVYDPLQIGTAPDGAWVRGEVVKGAGIRPPFAIEVRVRGRSIIAEKIEQ